MSKAPPGPTERYRRNEDLFDWMDQQFKRYGKIYKASILGTTAYVIADPAYIRHVLIKNWQNYTRGQHVKRIAFLMGNGIVVSEGDFWKRQRRMIQPAFHPKAINALSGLILKANCALLKKWELAAEKKEGVNVTHDVSVMILEVVLRSIFGADYEQIAPAFNMLSEDPTRNLEFARAFRSLGKDVLQVVAQRRKENSHPTDILGMIMRAKDPDTGQEMPDGQLVNEIFTLIIAGHETTASTLNWCWYLISQHPEVETKLSNELTLLMGSEFPSIDELRQFAYTQSVIEETMRLYPALWLMTRKAVNDDHFGEYHVPAGTEVYISPYFVHRNPDLWKDPDRFDPGRFDPNDPLERRGLMLLPFAAGPRNCIGEDLARLEMQIHVMLIAQKLRLQHVQTAPLEIEAGVNLRSKHDFIMTPQLKTID